MKREQIDHEGLKDHLVVPVCCCTDMLHQQREKSVSEFFRGGMADPQGSSWSSSGFKSFSLTSLELQMLTNSCVKLQTVHSIPMTMNKDGELWAGLPVESQCLG